MKFGDHIWNHHEEYIQISTNMLSIGSIICELGFKIEKFERKRILLHGTTNDRVLRVKFHTHYHSTASHNLEFCIDNSVHFLIIARQWKIFT